MMIALLILVGAYFLGSIPSGYIAGRIRGVDIRKEGSGNIGATNAFRILGKGTGSMVLICDGLKGFAAVTWLPDGIAHALHLVVEPGSFDSYRVLAGVMVVLGHNFTVWLNFKGGKGIATSAGVLAGLVPAAFGIVLGTWIIMCFLTKYVSVASITAAVVLPVSAWFLGARGLLFGVTALMGALAIVKHKGNIQRLMSGTENKIGSGKSTGTAGVKS